MNKLKTIELYILIGWIVGYISYISRKLLLKKCITILYKITIFVVVQYK